MPARTRDERAQRGQHAFGVERGGVGRGQFGVQAERAERNVGQAQRFDLRGLPGGLPDAVGARPRPEGEGGRIGLRLDATEEGHAISVEDDGIGLPDGEERARLTEPYVTHKAKGTGLGLAIVKKIMEDHGGRLALEDRPDGPGARAVLILPAEAAPGRKEDATLGVGRAGHGA